MPTLTASRLSAEEIAQFGDDGYLGPYTLCSPDEMAGIREEISRNVLTSEPTFPTGPLKDRHLDCRVIYDLASHEAITSRVSEIYGPDLLLFASSLFIKKPGYPPFPWHTDAVYWPVEPLVCTTAWIALSDATEANGCVHILPRSHKKPVPHRKFGGTPYHMLKRKLGIPTLKGLRAKNHYLDLTRKVSMPIKAGQFFLFSERVIHMSGANPTKETRMGLAARITVPLARIRHDAIFPGHQALVIRGEDRLGFNQLGSPPPAS